MHLPCEYTNNPCPVRFPVTCPPPRCDCQEDRTTPRHCRLCHLPFDIENRLLPGLQAFCSCFLGESHVIFQHRIPAVYWMPVVFFGPIWGFPGSHSGRSSLSSLSQASSHGLPLTADACLEEDIGSSWKPCDAEAFAESNHCDLSFTKGCSADCSTASSSVLDTLVESNCSSQPKYNIVAKDSDLTFLSEKAIQFEDSNSPMMKGDNANSSKSIFSELKHSEISPADSLSTKGIQDFTSSNTEGNGFKDENLNARAPLFSEVSNLESSRDILCCQGLASSNASEYENNSADICNYVESRYPSHTLNVSVLNTNCKNSLPIIAPTGPSHHQDVNIEPLNSIKAKSNCSNAYEKLRDPFNSHVAQVPLQHSNVETPMQCARIFEASSQQHAINFSSGNKLKDTFQMSSDQLNRTARSSLDRKHWFAENSPVYPGFNPHGNLASSNAGTDIRRDGPEIDFRIGMSTENRSGFVDGSDLIKEVMSMNRMGKNP